MSILKKLRDEAGYTQTVLAEKAGVSLRTIQRLEANGKVPHGYTLTVLSQVFRLETSDFQKLFLSTKETKESDKLSLKLINLSVLAFFLIPFGNLFVPFWVQRKKRDSEVVNKVGRKIINFQVFWSLILAVSLCVSPFIDPGFWPFFPLTLVVLFVALAVNILVVFFTANAIDRNKVDFLNLPLRLI